MKRWKFSEKQIGQIVADRSAHLTQVQELYLSVPNLSDPIA
jgi:hypothetical protein